MNGIEADPVLADLARKIIRTRPEVRHVEPSRVLFLRDRVNRPGSGCRRVLARCYSFREHPIAFFTSQPFGLVVYERNTDHMSKEQTALLLFHELLHIPPRGFKLVNHDRIDFAAILRLGGLDWTQPGATVPDILKGEK